MHTHVTIEVAYGRIERFYELMPQVKEIVEQTGWELEQALIQLNGKLFTVVHIWRMRDMNHYGEGIAFLTGHPRYPAIIAGLSEIVESETIVFADRTPYAPHRA